MKGTIVYKDISGGFWGIEGDDGKKYMPVNGIPTSFRQEGKRVEISVEPAGGMGIQMWGENVTLTDIKSL